MPKPPPHASPTDRDRFDDVLTTTGRALASWSADLEGDPGKCGPMPPELRDAVAHVMTALLRREVGGWRWESIDGIDLAEASRLGTDGVRLLGVVVLVSDQCVTPFALDVALRGSRSIASVRLRLGEPGDGPLGISGPPWGSSAASSLRMLLPGRIDDVAWVHHVDFAP